MAPLSGARSTNTMRQMGAKFVSKDHKTSKANSPATVTGSRLSTYSSVAESLVGWLTTGFPSLAITRSPPSFPGSASYCCLLRAILVNNSCRRVRPVYSPVTPRSINLQVLEVSRRRITYFRTFLDGLDAYERTSTYLEIVVDVLSFV